VCSGCGTALLYTLLFCPNPLPMPYCGGRWLLALLLSPLVSVLKRLLFPEPVGVLILCLIASVSLWSCRERARDVQRCKGIPELSEKLTERSRSLTGDLSSNQITVPAAQTQPQGGKLSPGVPLLWLVLFRDDD